MLFWFIAAAVTAVTCAALYYASLRRGVNAAELDPDAARLEHQRRRLAEIDEAVAQHRLGSAEGAAARAELAREILRRQDEGASAPSELDRRRAGSALPFALVGIAIVAFGSYGLLGNPGIADTPRAGRAEVLEQQRVADAVLQVEQQLAAHPDDLRGWTVIAPVYLSLGRYDDAVAALRQVNALQAPTPDTRTDLAEALVLANGGSLVPEARALLESAVESDPAHVRSRFYLAAETLRSGDYAAAEQHWRTLLGLGRGDEPWYQTARDGLAATQQGLRGSGAEAVLALPADQQKDMIEGMVEGLSDRLMAEGGTLEEWQRLVQSRLVLGQADLAQQAYNAARAAYPEPTPRTELDRLAQQGGLR